MQLINVEESKNKKEWPARGRNPDPIVNFQAHEGTRQLLRLRDV